MYNFRGCSQIMPIANRKLVTDDPWAIMETSQTQNWKLSIGRMTNGTFSTASTKESIGQEASSKSYGSSSQRAPKVVPTKGPSPPPSATTPTSTSAVVASTSTTAKRPEGHRAPLHPCQDVGECLDLERVDLGNLVEAAN